MGKGRDPINEAPGEISAGIKRVGNLAKNALGARAGSSAALGKLKVVKTATNLAKGWKEHAAAQDVPDTFMNVMTYMRGRGYEPSKPVYSQLATFMNTGKFQTTTPVDDDDQHPNNQGDQESPTEQAEQQPSAPTQAPQAPPQGGPPVDTAVGSEGTTGSVDTSRASPKPAPENGAYGQPQPTQPDGNGGLVDDVPQEIGLGDEAQWTNDGQDQFQTPRKVVWKSDDGKWTRFTGSHSAVPSNEVRVVTKNPNPPKAAKPKYRVQAGSSNNPNESYVDVLSRLVLEADMGIKRPNAQLNRKQIDGIMTIIARDLLRRGKVTFNNEDSDAIDNSAAKKTGTKNPSSPSDKFVVAPSGERVVNIDEVRFNSLLAQAGVTAEQLAKIENVASEHGHNIESIARSLRSPEDAELAKRVMAAAVMSLNTPLGDKR